MSNIWSIQRLVPCYCSGYIDIYGIIFSSFSCLALFSSFSFYFALSISPSLSLVLSISSFMCFFFSLVIVFTSLYFRMGLPIFLCLFLPFSYVWFSFHFHLMFTWLSINWLFMSFLIVISISVFCSPFLYNRLSLSIFFFKFPLSPFIYIWFSQPPFTHIFLDMRIPLSHYQILTIFLYLYILSNLSLYLFYFSLLPPLPTFLLSFNLLILLIFSFVECLLNSPLPCLLGEVFTSLCLLLNLPLLHTRLFVCRNIYLYCQAAFRPHVCACFIIIIIIFEGGGGFLSVWRYVCLF